MTHTNKCQFHVSNDTFEQIYLVSVQYMSNVGKIAQLDEWLRENIQKYLNFDIENSYVIINGKVEYVNQVIVSPDFNILNIQTTRGNNYEISIDEICSQEDTPLPDIINFKEYKEMLRNGEIAYHHIEPHLQINLPKGYNFITLVSRDNIRYLIQARLNSNTGMIF